SSHPPPPLHHSSTLSLHDALPISVYRTPRMNCWTPRRGLVNPTVIELLRTSAAITLGNLPRADAVFARFEQRRMRDRNDRERDRSEEHTSELQSRGHLVCRLLLEK